MSKEFLIAYDAEFTGLHKDTTLISLGFVSDNAYFYAEFADYDKSQVDDWLENNIINNLLFNDKESFVSHMGGEAYSVLMKGNRYEIASELLSWLSYQSKSHNSQIHILTDCYAYDWVLLNDLISDYGNALNIPDFVNYIPIDLSTAMFVRNIDPDINRESIISNDEVLSLLKDSKLFTYLGNAKHNSLWDAFIVSIDFKIIENKELLMNINKYSNDVNCRKYVIDHLPELRILDNLISIIYV